ncbi:MAG: hypothetical protein V4582_00865 [Pseudomonadota bacterium]
MTYLQITLKVAPENRNAAAAVYQKYKSAFLAGVPGAKSKELLIREEDVQVLHGFDSKKSANDYLASPLFTHDVVGAIGPLLSAAPQVSIYDVA